MRQTCHLAFWSICFSLVVTLVGGCVRVSVRPMPALPDLGTLKLSLDDSLQLARMIGDGPEAVAYCDQDTAGLTRPTMIRGARTAYPPVAREQGLQGWVALTFIIGADGVVEPKSVFVLAASDDSVVRPARSTILHSRFAPALRNGSPIRALARQVAEFRFK